MSVRAFATLLVLSVGIWAQAPVPAQPPAPNPAQPPAPNPLPVQPPTPAPAQPPPLVPPPVAPPTEANPPAVPTVSPAWPKQIGGKDLAAWLKELRESPDGYIRETAVKVLPGFGPTARGPALKPLIAQLKAETDPGVRMNIIMALGTIGADKVEDAKAIREALNGILTQAQRNSAVRVHATRSLGTYGSAAAFTIPTLVGIDEEPAWETRAAVATTLGRIAYDPKKGANRQALDFLTRRLAKEESAAVRLEIAQALYIIGPPNYNKDLQGDFERAIKPYLDAVTKKIDTEPDAATKVWLMMVLMRYDGRAYNDTTISKIADNLTRADVGGKVAALRALAQLGDKAKAALPTMLGTLKWEEPALLAEAISAIAAMNTVAKDALPDLERIKATNKDEYLKLLAAEAIEHVTGKKGQPKK